MATKPIETCTCIVCGTVYACNENRPKITTRPWHILHGRQGVRAYVASLGSETIEWLLALYVDDGLQLLAVDTIGQGSVEGVEVPFFRLIERGVKLKAKGFILVHNHPSGDPTPSHSDVRMTRRLADVSRELDMPLLDHIIIAGDQMQSVGLW